MKWFKFAIALVVLLLIVAWLLKPGLNQFKEFTGEVDNNGWVLETRKVNDYLVYAIFEKSAYRVRKSEYNTRRILQYTERYNGYLLNFQKSDVQQYTKEPEMGVVTDTTVSF